MISTVLWISSDEARLFRFSSPETEVTRLRKHGAENHGQKGANHAETQDEAKFFKEISETLLKNKADRFLFIGPGLAKTHFKDYVAHHSAESVKQVVGVEAFEKATDGEIEDFAHRFFKKLDVFQF